MTRSARPIARCCGADTLSPRTSLLGALHEASRNLLIGGHFVAEGSLVVEQLLALRREDGTPRFRLVSLLGTEQMLGRLAPTKPGAQIQLGGVGTEQMLGRLAPAIQRADEALRT